MGETGESTEAKSHAIIQDQAGQCEDVVYGDKGPQRFY